MADDWSEFEVNLIITDYFNMLKSELSGIPFNKSQHRKILISHLNNRSEGSIEFKHQNISAALIKLGLPYIKGYKRRDNYQQILDEKIVDYLQNEKKNLIPKFQYFAENSETIISTPDFARIIVEAPEIQVVQELKIEYKKRPIKVNYIEQEQKNATLGLKGEALIIEYEKWRLVNEGKESLANKIEWISKDDDGAGFDILSKNKNGTDRYIEVKTTKLNKDTPFFFSKNEYECSKEKSSNYHLYRLFDFSEAPKLFLLNGDFDAFCQKEAIQYKGYF